MAYKVLFTVTCMMSTGVVVVWCKSWRTWLLRQLCPIAGLWDGVLQHR